MGQQTGQVSRGMAMQHACLPILPPPQTDGVHGTVQAGTVGGCMSVRETRCECGVTSSAPFSQSPLEPELAKVSRILRATNNPRTLLLAF